MSCNTFIPIMDLVREVEALLAANYIDKDDPRITGGVFTNPTIKEGFLLDVQAREEFCRLVQECGLDAPFGKMWLSRPLYPDSMFVSYEDSGEPQTKWKTIQAVLESAGVFGPAATSLSSRLTAEIDRATTAENEIISRAEAADVNIVANEESIAANATAISDESERAVAAEGVLTSAVDALVLKDLSLQSQVNSIGGGKKAYVTYALMVADKDNITANSSIDVTNDTDPLKNGTYSYDGAVFTKSIYDVETIVRTKVLNTFKTKALMDASALPDGADAQVTNDPANNGLYVRTAGAWVKSAYDPVTLAKADATSKADAALAESKVYTNKEVKSLRNYDWDYIELTNTTPDFLTIAGEVLDFTPSITSDFIPVKKGDVYSLVNLRTESTLNYLSYFTLYGPSKVLIGSLSSGLTKQPITDKDELLINRVGIYNDVNDFSRVSVVIPQDGFIKVSFLNIDSPDTKLYKTDFEGLINNGLNFAPREVLNSFKDVLYSVVTDAAITDLGNISKATAVGADLTFSGDNNKTSIRYPVKAGDYIHLQSRSHLRTDAGVFFEDVNGKFLGFQEVYGEYSVTGDREGSVLLNMRSKHTGFVRVSSSKGYLDNLLLGITADEVSYVKPYLTSSTKIEFFNSSIYRPSNLKVPLVNLVTLNNITNTNTNNVNIHARSLPYVLKKGEVLEYKIDATTNPLIAVAMKDGHIHHSLNEQVNQVLPLVANEVISTSVGLELLKNIDTNETYFGSAREGKVAYCNEENDTVIIFFKPNPLSSEFSEYSCSEYIELNVYDKDTYIAKRDAELKERFKKMSFQSTTQALSVDGLTPENYSNCSYPSVLMFKGEVLNCLIGSLPKALAYNLAEGDANGIADKESMFNMTGVNMGELYLPIREYDTRSWAHGQVFCKRTSVVYLGFAYLNESLTETTDVEGMISNQVFEPRILKLAEAEVGKNLMPTFMPLYLISQNPNAYVSARPDNSHDCYQTFVGAGKYILNKYWVMYGNAVPLYAPLSATGNMYNYLAAGPSFKHTQNTNEQGELIINGLLTRREVDYVDYFEEDSVYVVSSRTVSRELVDTGNEKEDIIRLLNPLPEPYVGTDITISSLNNRMINTYEHSLEDVSEDFYNENYKVSDGTFLQISDLTGLSFNFLGPVSISLDDEYQTEVQIKQHGKVLVVLNSLTANQGQSTALLIRKNINIEFLNSEGEDFFIQFGEYQQEAEIVLKSYLRTDKGHMHEGLSCETWYNMRTYGGYPEYAVLPDYIMSDLSRPQNQTARGVAFTIPCEVHFGGEFYSLASVRCKKKRDNYGITKGKHEHIFLEASGKLNPEGMSWLNVELGGFEVREPKMDGYEEGDRTLPAAYPIVDAAITRLFDWFNGVMSGTIDLKETYKDYIDLNSFIDYFIFVSLSGNPDALYNNFLMVTYDATVWRMAFSDGDQSFGTSSQNGETTPYNVGIPSTTIFSRIYAAFGDETKSRYADLRRGGIISEETLSDYIIHLNSMMKLESKELDALYWGQMHKSATLPFTLDWIHKKIIFLDAVYGYLDDTKKVVVQGVKAEKTLEANEISETTLPDVDVKAGDKLITKFGYETEDLTVLSEATSDGVVKLFIKNESSEPLTYPESYYLIRKM